MGADKWGTNDVDNQDLHRQTKLCLKKLVDAARTKFNKIQAKDVAARNAKAHRTPQKELEAQANDRKARQMEVDKNNGENVRKHYEKKAAAATATAIASIVGDNVHPAFSNEVERTPVPETTVEKVVAPSQSCSQPCDCSNN